MINVCTKLSQETSLFTDYRHGKYSYLMQEITEDVGISFLFIDDNVRYHHSVCVSEQLPTDGINRMD